MPSQSNSSTPAGGSGPAWCLIFLSPLIAEVLSGATRLSILFVYIPEVLCWGCGALLAREWVVRRKSGWCGLLLAGLALSVAEETLIQQTSLAPLPWLGAGPIYGRAIGVNWTYFLYMLGYESIWVVVVPVALTDVLFPQRRNRPWLGVPGLSVAGVAFVIGSLAAWAAWVKHARTEVFHAVPYQPSRVAFLLGVISIVLLVIAAGRAQISHPSSSRSAPSPYIAGLAALGASAPWFLLLALVFSLGHQAPFNSLPFEVPLIVAALWAFGVMRLFGTWAALGDWSDRHRLAMVFGAILYCMLSGYPGSSAWPKMDLVFKAAINVLAVILLIVLVRKVGCRAASVA